MIHILFLCLFLATNDFKADGSVPRLSKEEDLELERELKLINKPPLKSIQAKFGYIVDCIDMHKQLAFDHPLLKNHKLQLKPNFNDTTTKTNVHDRSKRLSKIGLEKDLCPSGTVPIRRTTKEDLIRAKRLSNITSILNQAFPGEHFAEVDLNVGGPYYAVNGIISIYNLTLANDQMSAAYVWLKNGPEDTEKNVNNIFTGWQVFPHLYGDSRTYFYVSWSDRSRNRGCWNMRCPGFVQVDKQNYVGTVVEDTSTSDGPQYDMSQSIVQDPKTKNWWVKNQNVYVGYYPAALFSNLSSANRVGWGGTTVSPAGEPSPPMGSGNFPNAHLKHSMYIRQMSYQDEARQDLDPVDVYTYNDSPNCYKVKYYGRTSPELGCIALLGGPGGTCGI